MRVKSADVDVILRLEAACFDKCKEVLDCQVSSWPLRVLWFDHRVKLWDFAVTRC